MKLLLACGLYIYKCLGSLFVQWPQDVSSFNLVTRGFCINEDFSRQGGQFVYSSHFYAINVVPLMATHTYTTVVDTSMTRRADNFVLK